MAEELVPLTIELERKGKEMKGSNIVVIDTSPVCSAWEPFLESEGGEGRP